VQTLSMVKNMGNLARLKEATKPLFSEHHMCAIKKTEAVEKDLEAIHAQEYLHQITNLTLHGLNWMIGMIENTSLCDKGKIWARRGLAITIPALIAIDLIAAVFLEGIMLATGVMQLIIGRGPIYTEITQNPLFHIKFILHTALKTVGSVLGTIVWPFSAEHAFKTSQACTKLFYNIQMNYIMLKLRFSMWRLKESEITMVPIVFGLNNGSSLSLPVNSMHKTYLIIEKKDENYDLYWINRDKVTKQSKLDLDGTLYTVRNMLDKRFPYINNDEVNNYPPRTSEPSLGSNSSEYMSLPHQGTDTNCVLSNLFGAFDCIDNMNNTTDQTMPRYAYARSLLASAYDFYKWDYTPYVGFDETFTRKDFWTRITTNTNRSI
ncbi:MAG: hypothetical protein P0S94_03190, partial [Simkaniaceae bacterium]|nr:hypothetical protein [Simkaniaceae bacterium]